MNFGENIKREILSKPIKDKCCKYAFLAGIIRGSGLIYEDEDGEFSFDFKIFSEEEAQIVSDYFSFLFGYQLREVSLSLDRLNKRETMVVSIKGNDAIEILTELKIIEKNGNDISVNFDFYGDIIKKECCFKSFLRGLFLSSGGCTVPDGTIGGNTGYHLEIVFSHNKPASATAEKLNDCGLVFKITRRKENFVLYIKSAEAIKDFLAYLSTPVSVLELTDIIIKKEVTNDSNRRANCDMGNVNRQIEATEKQIEAIKIIQRTGTDNIKADLVEVMNARVKYKDDTLSELSKRLNLSKSCVNHRLRKIIAIAKEMEK